MDISKLVKVFSAHGLRLMEVYQSVEKGSTGAFRQYVVVHEHKPDKKDGGTGMTKKLSDAIKRFQKENRRMNIIVRSTESIAFMEEQLDAGEFERIYEAGIEFADQVLDVEERIFS